MSLSQLYLKGYHVQITLLVNMSYPVQIAQVVGLYPILLPPLSKLNILQFQ